MTTAAMPLAAVLCVDDEPRVLEGLKLTLRRGFHVTTATSGQEALATLDGMPACAVVISDMRMPGMDGATFLAQVRTRWPDAVRLLLTGEPGRDGAIAAVNEGQIFRFLTKPCPPDRLLAAVEAAVRQHQVVTAEKTLLQQTALGTIRALVDVLAIVNPVAFGHGGRIKRLTLDLAKAAGLEPSWELEAAALMSQVGFVALPFELVEKAINGEPLCAAETASLREVPKVAQRLLARIPRLENVAAILAQANRATAVKECPDHIAAGAAVLMNAIEFDALTSQGEDAATAIATLRARGGAPAATLMTHLAQLHGIVESGPQVREIPLRDVRPGMLMLDDLRSYEGTLLVSRGYEISQNFIDRMRSFGPGVLAERVRVQLRPDCVPAPPPGTFSSAAARR